jgi:hypothetical protein
MRAGRLPGRNLGSRGAPMVRLSTLALSMALLAVSLQAQWITGYYGAGNGVLPISAIPWNNFTTIVHFAASTDGEGNVATYYIRQQEIRQLVAAGHAHGKKVLVNIIDNTADYNYYGRSTAPGRIQTFVKNIAAFVRSNGYDGVDLDWEQNVIPAQYAQLAQMVRAALPGYLITAAVFNNPNIVSAMGKAWPYLDQINMECYHMDAAGNGFSWFNAALFQAGNSSVCTCDWRVKPFLTAGVPPSKVGIGVPFYGRKWQGVTRPLVNGYFRQSQLYYRDLVTDSRRWQPQYKVYDETYKANYLSIPSLNEFDTYSGVEQMQDLNVWIKSKGFGGAMAFLIDYEYVAGAAGAARYPLSTALHNIVMQSANAGPAILSGSPSGALPASTTEATLSVTTNVSANCKYSTSAGVAYEAMPLSLASTGGTASSTPLTGLAAGARYTYYVRCADFAGKANTSDYVVSFSVAAPARIPGQLR